MLYLGMINAKLFVVLRGLLTAFLSAQTVYAAPAVTNVLGNLQHGQTATVSGSGFGSHGDFHGDSDKIIRVFDDFNDSNFLSNPYMSWLTFNLEENAILQSNSGPRTSIAGDGFYRRSNIGLGWLGLNAGNRSEYYMSYYMRLSPGFDILSAGSGTHQFKIVRLYSTNNGINLYPAIGDDGFHMVAEFVEPIVMRYQLQLGAIPDKPSGWHKMTIWYKKNSSPNANDGKCRIWWDNRLIFDWMTHFQDPKNNPDYAPGYPITGDFDVDDANLAGEWAIGDYFSSAGSQTWVDFDDIYVSHTQARVELGNAPTYSACTVLETQVPTAWSGGQIAVKLNMGALGSGAKYLYVIDSNGSVNNNGFLLGSSGGGGPTVNLTPAPPVNFREE